MTDNAWPDNPMGSAAWVAFMALASAKGCPSLRVAPFTERFMAVHSSTPVTAANTDALLTWMETQPWESEAIPDLPDKRSREGWTTSELAKEYARRWRS